MIPHNVRLILILLATTLNIQEIRSKSSSGTRSHGHQSTTSKRGAADHPATECFRTGTESNGISEHYYEHFVTSELCLKQESDRLKQQGSAHGGLGDGSKPRGDEVDIKHCCTQRQETSKI
ncbi:uncharacterized protein [Periplaneta americana]|uniref:uncharacterized protein isoform X2 n=1 Tax=Periplaneta americana TaxID=6978 RepID=UPI0037E8438C